jgi:hypothetical protein
MRLSAVVHVRALAIALGAALCFPGWQQVAAGVQTAGPGARTPLARPPADRPARRTDPNSAIAHQHPLKPIFQELLGPPASTDSAPPPTGDPSAAGPAR